MYKDITWEYTLRYCFALPALNFDFLFLWDENLKDLMAHIHVGDALLKILFHAALMTGVSVQHVPSRLFDFFSLVHFLIPQDYVKQTGETQINHAQEHTDCRGNRYDHYR